jgi:phage terminase large subunit
MSVAVKRIETGYKPRPLQAELHRTVRRFSVVVCHRRFGKTVWALNHMIDSGLRCQLHNPQYAYLAPTYGQAKRVAWDYLKQFTANIPGVVVNEADLRIDIPRPSRGDRIRFMLLGAENPMALKGIYLDGNILDEYGEMNPLAWREVIRPALSDRKGWSLFIGTFKGRNHFYDIYQWACDPANPEKENWFRAIFKASETGIIDAAELASAKASMTEEEYLQEYECEADAGMVGAYFTKEIAKAKRENRIGNFPHDPKLPVDTFWDLGIDDMAAVWFVQSLRGLHRVIDYYEISGASIPDVIGDLRKKPYTFGEWVFPHDVQARDFSTGKAQLQIFQGLGCKPTRVIPRVGTKREGINAARMIFSMCEFDEHKCKRGLDALANYQKKWNSKNNVFEESPLHNWASNGSDAFQQFALGVREGSRDSSGQRRYGSQIKVHGAHNPFNFRGNSR